MPLALVITAPGINCDRELVTAFALAGATVETAHLNELLESPAILDRFDLIGLPGGFSFGDDIAAGRIMAALMRQTLYPAFVRAIQRGTPMIAPCNGFQIAVQMGLLPGPLSARGWPTTPPPPNVALAENTTARFVDRWVRVEIPDETCCIWTQGIEMNDRINLLPIANGQGRFVAASDDLLNQIQADGQVALRYSPIDNPNGSSQNIAGICDATGLVFGLMPHPERYTRWTQHPWWTRLDRSSLTREPPGMQMFHQAVNYVNQLKHESSIATADSQGTTNPTVV